MITLKIIADGNLLVTLDKGCKDELQELLDKATNTDAIIVDMLDSARYLGNDWHAPQSIGLTDAPSIAHGAIYNDTENDEVGAEDYEQIWYYPYYMVKSFAEELLNEGRVVFKKV